MWRNSEEKVILEGQDLGGRMEEQLGNGPKAVYMVAGDSAYGISPFLIKAYKVQRNVHQCLSLSAFRLAHTTLPFTHASLLPLARANTV